MKEFWAYDLFAKLGVRMVFLFCSSSLATGLSALACTGTFPAVSESQFLNIPVQNVEKTQMDQRKRFPTHHADSKCHVTTLGRGSVIHENLEQRQIDWERGIIVH